MMLTEGDDEPEQQQGFIKNRKRGKKPTPGYTKIASAKKRKDEKADQEMEDANPEGDYSSDCDESEGVVVQMEGNEMGDE